MKNNYKKSLEFFIQQEHNRRLILISHLEYDKTMIKLLRESIQLYRKELKIINRGIIESQRELDNLTSEGEENETN